MFKTVLMPARRCYTVSCVLRTLAAFLGTDIMQETHTQLRTVASSLCPPARTVCCPLSSSAQVAESKFLNNCLVEVVAFMEKIALKDSGEKDVFFKKLPAMIPAIPEPVAVRKVLPQLSNALEYGGAPATAVSSLLLIGRCVLVRSGTLWGQTLPPQPGTLWGQTLPQQFARLCEAAWLCEANTATGWGGGSRCLLPNRIGWGASW